MISDQLEYDYNASQMKLTIDELTIKLEEKTMLLTKAKHAIDTLTFDNNKMRLEKDRANELEERLHKSKRANDDMNQQYHAQFVQLEADLISARHLYTSKSNEYIEMTEKLATADLSNKLLLSQLDDSSKDKEKLKEQLMLLSQRYNDLEDEITQCRAHVELYKLQYDESLDRVKEVENILNTNNVNHQMAIDKLIAEQDKLKSDNDSLLEEVKNNYLLELEEMNEYMKSQVKKIREDDNKEYSLRIQEKKDEIQNLRSVIDKDKLHTEALMRELEAVRVELRIKSEILDEYRKDIGVKAEEVQTLRKSSEQNIKLKETLSHLNMEKGVLTNRFEQIKRDHEVASENLSRIQSSHAALESENALLKKETSNLRIKCELVEEISRENERLKMHNIALKGDNQDLAKDLASFKEESNKWYTAAIKARDDLGFYENQFTSMTILKEELEVQLSEQKEKIHNIEAAYTEARNSTVELRHSLLETTNALNSLKSSHRELIGICNIISEVIPAWDELLTSCLEGNSSTNSFIGKFGKGSQHLSPKGDRYQDGDDNNSIDIPEPGNLKHDVILGIERIRIKMDRAQKIRANFDNQSKRLIEALITTSNTTEMQLQLANHRLTDATNKITILQRAIDRDQKLREEFQTFKEKVMREQEDKYNDICIQLESKRKDEEKHLQLIDSLTTTVDTQTLKLQDYDDIKFELQNVKNRIVDLSKDLDIKNSMLEELRNSSNNMKIENITLIEKNSKLEEKVQQLEDKNIEHRKDIEQLKKRQIDPELAMQIRQTQSMIQESVFHERSPTYERPVPSTTSREEMTGLPKHLYDVSELLNNADSLINRIAELINRFENYHNRGIYENGSSIISQFEQDLFTLLESTSRMSFQLQMLTAEVRKSNRNSNESINFNHESRSKIFSSTPINRVVTENKGSSQWGDTFSTGSSPDEREFLQPKNTVFNDIVYPSTSAMKITPISTDISNSLSQTYPYASPKYSNMQPRSTRESPPTNNNSYYDRSPKVTINTNTSIPRRTQSNKLETDLKLLSKKLDSIKSNFM